VLALLPVGCGEDTTAPERPTLFDVRVAWPNALEAGFTRTEWVAVEPAYATHSVSVLAEETLDAAAVAAIRFSATCRRGDPLSYPHVRLKGFPDPNESWLVSPCTVSLVLGCTEDARELVVPPPDGGWLHRWDERTLPTYSGSCGLYP